jgi:hypothetical protein
VNQNHQPDPEFISHLEWQVRTALRREERFAQPVEARSGGRMKIVTLVLVSALFGAGGVVVKDEVQEARQQELLLAEVQGNLRLAELEMDLIMSQYEEAEDHYQAGLLPRDAILSARLALLRAETRLERLQLDEEEIRATGRAPRNELSAPRVRGQDLVTERLELERSVAMEELTVAQAQLSRMQELYESEVVGNLQLMEGMAPVRQAESRVRELERRMELRRQVLEGAISGEEAEREVELSQVRGELDVLERASERAAMQLGTAEERVGQGLAGESELLGARLQLLQFETRMEVLRMKLDILEGRDTGSGGDR